MRRKDEPPEGFMEELPDIPLPDNRMQQTRYSDYGSYYRPTHQSISGMSWSNIQSVPQKNTEGWMKSHWRPAMAWQYFTICVFDFLLAPGFQMWLFSSNIDKYVQWSPLTLQNGGIYHAAMGLILGIYAWSRGQEKIRGRES